MLEAHLSRQRGAAGVISEGHRDVNVLKAKLRVAELEVANALGDKRRLERFISSRLSDAGPPASADILDEASEPASGRIDYRQAFECTAQALMAVIERAEIFEVHKEKKGIRDMSARPDKQEVVGPVCARFFIEWLQNRP